MRKPFRALAALICLAGAASATDMPVKAPLVVTYDWTGFYVGGYFGDSISSAKAHTDALTSGIADLNQKSFTVGGTAGFNWQLDPRWLTGVEADVGTLGINRTIMQWNDFANVGEKADGYGTLRARFGYVTGPSLLYITGGAAFVHVRDAFGGTATAGPTTNDATKFGWTAGGGIETRLSRAWSAKTEYLYIQTGSSTFASNVFGGPFTTTFDHSFHVIKTGLAYKLGEPFFDGLPLLGRSVLLPSDHNWNGFYAGFNAGGGISNVHALGGGGTLSLGTEEDVNGGGATAGVQAGYNYMVWSRYFVGVEADYGYLGIRGRQRDWNDTVRFADSTSWYATARARVGTTTGPALLYLTAGGAWVHVTDTLALIGATSQSSRTQSGFTFGGGTEVALNARWSAKIESLYIDAGHNNLAVGAAHGDFKDRFVVVRAGLNLKLW